MARLITSSSSLGVDGTASTTLGGGSWRWAYIFATSLSRG
jgi:hypothetical protein